MLRGILLRKAVEWFMGKDAYTEEYEELKMTARNIPKDDDDEEVFRPKPQHHDPVNHPAHYTAHPSGVECIEITEHMTFCLGNAIKYIWRAGEKGDPIQDLSKAIWYVEREIDRLRSRRKGND